MVHPPFWRSGLEKIMHLATWLLSAVLVFSSPLLVLDGPAFVSVALADDDDGGGGGDDDDGGGGSGGRSSGGTRADPSRGGSDAWWRPARPRQARPQQRRPRQAVR